MTHDFVFNSLNSGNLHAFHMQQINIGLVQMQPLNYFWSFFDPRRAQKTTENLFLVGVLTGFVDFILYDFLIPYKHRFFFQQELY